MQTLNELKSGSKCKVMHVKNSDFKKRLLELGFTTGEDVTVVKIAPWGRTMLIEIRGAFLALDSNVASSVVINKTEG